MNASNFEGSEQPGEYRISYRYLVTDSHAETAKAREVPAIWTGEIQSQAAVFTRGDVPPARAPDGGEPEDNIDVVFPDGGYRLTLAEAAAGVKLKYEIVVKKDLPGVMFLPLDVGQAMGPGTSALSPFESIHGNGQSYSQSDIGLGAGPVAEAITIKRGRYEQMVEWQGRNWSGPSDTGMPQGEPFPAGTYSLTVKMAGNIDTPEGRRFYRLRKSAPVVLVP